MYSDTNRLSKNFDIILENNLNPTFNIEAFKTEINNQSYPHTTFLHKEILDNLLNQIQEIDFVKIVRPEAKILIDEYNKIQEANERGDKKLYKKLNTPLGKDETNRTLEIELVLQKLRKGIKQKHHVVCIISELLRIANYKKWNLSKCYDYVYVYNGAFWKQLNKEDLKHFLGKVAIKLGYPKIEGAHYLFQDELLKQFLTQAHLPPPEHDSKRILINLQNGSFEFRSHERYLRPFDPKDFLTYQLPFKYDAEASCPLFDTYLKKVLPDLDTQSVLQEFSGFIFTNLNIEKCLVLTGGGSNGKSVFYRVLTSLIGVENTLSYTLGSFKHEYNRAKLTNVLLNYSSEKGADVDVETFKALVSGEPLQAREPYGKPFTIFNKVKFIINCNELPKETESTEAFFRRYLIIPFEIKIPDSEKDINLAEKIINSELPGVFNWLLIGLERLLLQNKFTQSKVIDNAVDEFKKQADNVALFIEEFDYKFSSNEKQTLAELYSKYCSFCRDDNYKPLGKNRFSLKLESKGFASTRLNDGSKGFFIENKSSI